MSSKNKPEPKTPQAEEPAWTPGDGWARKVARGDVEFHHKGGACAYLSEATEKRLTAEQRSVLGRELSAAAHLSTALTAHLWQSRDGEWRCLVEVVQDPRDAVVHF